MSIKYTTSGGIITTITTFSFMGATESDTTAISYSVTGNTLKTVDYDGPWVVDGTGTYTVSGSSGRSFFCF